LKEFMVRLFANPFLGCEVIAASCFVNILALASPLFVMQILRRYVTFGVDATLITLVTGALIAIILEFIFRESRMHLAKGLSQERDTTASLESFSVLTKSRLAALDRISPSKRQEVVNGISNIETAYNPNNITTIIDVPFALLFIFVLFLINPILSGIAALFLIFVFLGSSFGSLFMRTKTKNLMEKNGTINSLISTANREPETIRAFNAGQYIREVWEKQQFQQQVLRQGVSTIQSLIQTCTQSATGLMSITIVTAGAILVVQGNMDVGALIGANILSARALQPISKFSQLSSTFANARESMELYNEFKQLPLEQETGSAKEQYTGSIDFRDVGFAFPGANTPLFEGLSTTLSPGSVTIIIGSNGSGKTTLARLLTGMLEPARGQIFVDGLGLHQVSMEWWRQQIVYMPQEPSFLNASIEDNLRTAGMNADNTEINRVIDNAGLKQFIDESQDNIKTMISENGKQLSRGIRHRLALARALLTNGRLVILDEPFEGMDADGNQVVQSLILSFIQQKRTVIIFTHNKNIIKGNHILIDLNAKPTPKIEAVEMNAPSNETKQSEQQNTTSTT